MTTNYNSPDAHRATRRHGVAMQSPSDTKEIVYILFLPLITLTALPAIVPRPPLSREEICRRYRYRSKYVSISSCRLQCFREGVTATFKAH